MKKVILSLAVLSLAACHSTTEVDLQLSDSAEAIKAVDSIVVVSDSVKVDSVKIDSLK